MTHAEIWAGIPAVYAARIIELEKQLGECSGALQHAEKRIAELREDAWVGKAGGYVHIAKSDWLAIMGELP